MFSSAGFFKGYVCPFYENGSCSRPYCHYRHSLPASKRPPCPSNKGSMPITNKSNEISEGFSLQKGSSVLVQDDRSFSPISSADKGESSKSSPPPSVVAELPPAPSSAAVSNSTNKSLEDSQEPIICYDSDTIMDLFGSDGSTEENYKEKDTVEGMGTQLETIPHEKNDLIDVINIEEDVINVEEEFQRVTALPVDVQRTVETGQKRKDKSLSYENTGVKKHRVAYSKANETRNPKLMVSSFPKGKSTTNTNLQSVYQDTSAIYTGKKRIARPVTLSPHRAKEKASLSCPKLPLLTSTKIPTKLRQKFLDSFFDEHIRIGTSPQVASQKALKDEELLVGRCSNKSLYLNLASQELRRLRAQPATDVKDDKTDITGRSKQQSTPLLHHSVSECEVKVVKCDSVPGDTLVSSRSETATSVCSDEVAQIDINTETAAHVSTKNKKVKKKKKSKHSELSFESALASVEVGKKKQQRHSSTSSNEGSVKQLKSPKLILEKIQPSGGIEDIGSSSSTSSEKSDKSNDVIISSDQLKGPLPSPSFPPPSFSPLVNLTKVALSRAGPSSSSVGVIKKLKVTKPKPQPKPTYSIMKKKAQEFNLIVFREQLNHYLLTEEQLCQNGYPRPTKNLGIASINRENDRMVPAEIVPIGPNAMQHCCCRCQKPFVIYNNGDYQTVEDCVYHFGRLYKSKEYGEGIVSKYSCCGERRDSAGCKVAKMHVTAGTKLSEECGYVQTVPFEMNTERIYHPEVLALDCEMCYTTVGLQLTRVSLVNAELKPVFESLVKPSHPIVDYNTQFSGLTAENFVGVEVTQEEIQQKLLQKIFEDTILIGHSLESDLKALKIIHSHVVDTALVFPHRKGLPFKRSLKNIMAEYLLKFIQDNIDGGHDSLEDSVACMELMIWKVKQDLQKTARR